MERADLIQATFYIPPAMSKHIRVSVPEAFWQQAGNAIPSVGTPMRTGEQRVPHQSWRNSPADGGIAFPSKYSGHSLGDQRACIGRPVQTHAVSLSERS